MEKIVVLFLLMISFSVKNCTQLKSNYSTDDGTLSEVYNRYGSYENLEENAISFFKVEKLDTIYVNHIEGDFSKFDTKNKTIYLSKNHVSRAGRTLAHELAHILMAELTTEVNLITKNRFWDEGYAEIFAYTVMDQIEYYKEKCIGIARKYKDEKSLSFSIMQDWDSFYDRYGSGNYDAYNIGASFVFFLFDYYNQNDVYSLLKDTKNSENLLISIQNLKKISGNELEQLWLKYID